MGRRKRKEERERNIAIKRGRLNKEGDKQYELPSEDASEACQVSEKDLDDNELEALQEESTVVTTTTSFVRWSKFEWEYRHRLYELRKEARLKEKKEHSKNLRKRNDKGQ